MIPAIFVFVDALPHMRNMKVDRKALPKLGHERPALDQGFVAPRTSTEGVIAQIWKDLLRRDKVGIYDNFLELGGHSLLATQVVNKIRHVYAVDLPLRDFFESPTVSSVAENLESKRQVVYSVDEKIEQLLQRVKGLSNDQARTLTNLKQLESGN